MIISFFQWITAFFKTKAEAPTAARESFRPDLSGQVQTLVEAGKTTEALNLLEQTGDADAVFLRDRYDRLMKLQNSGNPNGQETAIELNRIHFALLEMVRQHSSPPPAPALELREQVQQLIATGKTEEALNALIEAGFNDVAAIQTRLTNSRTLYETGKMSFGEWMKTQVQINQAALTLMGGGEQDKNRQTSAKARSRPGTLIPMTDEQKAELQKKLLVDGDTEAVMEICDYHGLDFVLFKARYSMLIKHWNLGLIDHEELVNAKKQIDDDILANLEAHSCATDD